MQLYDFTVPELNRFRDLCNFTPDELRYFELRSKYKSNVEIALTMHISEAKLSRLGKELRDFIQSLYTATASENERILLGKIITDLKDVI